MNGLAYVDIGKDNGGIVLNLSEGGLGFRAVGPLDRTDEVQFSIQLPNCPERIEATAQVTWLGTSNRQAGAKFLSVAGDGRARIQDWIRSQEVLGGAWADTPRPRKPVSEIRPRRDAARDHGAPEIQAETFDVSPSAGGSSALLAELSKGPVPDSAAASELVEENVNPALTDTAQTGGEPWREDSIPPDVEVPAGAEASNDDQGQQASVLAESSLGSPLSYAATLPEDTSVFTSITDSVHTTARSVGLPPVAVVAGFLLVFAALCFAIGTWVGSPKAASHPIAQLTPPKVTPPPAEAALPRPDDLRSAPARPDSTAKKSHARPVEAETPAPTPGDDAAASTEPSASERLNSSSQTAQSSAEPPSAPVNVPSPQAAAQSASLAPATTPPPAAIVQNPAMVAAPAPAPADTPAPVTTRMIDGITVKSTDRFIPSRLTYRVEPDYPAQARQQLVEGTVRIHQVIGPDGTVRSVKLLSGSILLAPAAMEAARYWQYFPALLNGDAVQSEKDIEIDFRIPR